MKPTRRLRLTVMSGACLLAAGCRRTPGASAPEDPHSERVPVRVAQATVTTLRPSIDLIGTVLAIPERTTEVTTQVAGQIVRVSVVEGQAVRAGETLVQLDSRPAEARRDRARANEQRARATLVKLEHGPRLQELEAAREIARQLNAGARLLRLKFDALRLLHEKGEASDVGLGQAQARLDAADAERGAADARLRLLEAGTRPEEIAAARADVAAAEAEATSAELAVEFCTIKSPIDGIVMQLSARGGASVSPADRLAIVVDTSELFVQVRIPASHLSSVRRGAGADVWLASDDDATVRGRVARLSPQADPASGAVDAFVSIPNDHETLRSGLSRRVRVWLPARTDVLAIPVAAVADRDGTSVVTVIRGNRAYEQAVRLGVTTVHQAQVIEGLEKGDLIATEGGYALPEGCRVRIVPASTATEPGASAATTRRH